MKLVVMQPTYLPWAGYFDLIDSSDVFVFLDTVQFEKQSWQQRNRIKAASGPQWLTVPVYQKLGQPIVDVRINNTVHWRHKHWMSLVSHYGRARFFGAHAPWLEALYAREWESLAELNVHLIMRLAELFGMSTRFVRSSTLAPLEGKKVEPLLTLCKQFGADVYLSPAGAREYLVSDEPFREKGVRLEFQAYAHPTWPQLFGEFTPFLSALDLLLNTGDEAAAILRSGNRPGVAVGAVDG